jgi:hypothetical protein
MFWYYSGFGTKLNPFFIFATLSDSKQAKQINPNIKLTFNKPNAKPL